MKDEIILTREKLIYELLIENKKLREIIDKYKTEEEKNIRLEVDRCYSNGGYNGVRS